MTAAACVALDPCTRDGMVLEQLPQVRFAAQRLRAHLPPCVALEDLVHSGLLGLLDAVDKYDRRRRVQLKSYAAFRIRGAMLDSLREMDWGPRSLRSRARQMEQTRARLLARLGRPPCQAEVASAMGLPLKAFYRLLRDLHALELTSYPDPADFREPRSLEEDPHAALQRKERQALLAAAIARLPDKERRAVALYYYEELTMSEVGERLGVGESRVSQLHASAMAHLRETLGTGV